MSAFLNPIFSDLSPYIPGEQPQNRKYLKLNTNESPFSPSPLNEQILKEKINKLNLYSDPNNQALNEAFSKYNHLKSDQVMATNGSDEALNYAFLAYGQAKKPILFADISYGFYEVLANLYSLKYEKIPLKEDFSIDIKDYMQDRGVVVIANPNAPTGIALSLDQIEQIVKANPNNIVIIDEAYVDFGAKSAVSLIDKYQNLIVIQTFSKSRSLAGARLGFALSNSTLIKELNTLRNSCNPYNVNSITSILGINSIKDEQYFRSNCLKIMQNREYCENELKKLDFKVLQSKSNFLFAKASWINGENLYLKLKQEGILVRHFDKTRIKDYNRISIGTKEQMEEFIKTIKLIKRDYHE